MTRRSGRVALVVWLVGLSTGFAALWAAPRPQLRSPDPLAQGLLARDLLAQDVLDVVTAVAHLLGIALLGYLLVLTVAQLLLGLAAGQRRRRQSLHRWCAAAGPTFLATLTTVALSTPAAGATLAGDDDAGTGPSPGLGATMQLTDDDVRTELPWAESIDGPGPDGGSGTGIEAEPDATGTAEPTAGPRHTSSEWTVRPGDHLWGIAEDIVARRAGQDPARDAASGPDVRTVHRYWLELVHANRDRLVDPENPDLILPGQTLVIPDL